MKIFALFLIMVFSTNTSYAENNNGDYVVILHGIARSSSHMQPVAERLEKEGYDVINLDYPSTKYTIEELTDIIHKELSSKLTEDKKVHFVGYSMGGVLVRTVLAKYRPEKLGRVVQLAAPNGGSEVADFLKNNALYKFFYGPAGQQLTTNNTDTRKLMGAVDYELGVIAGNSTIDPISSYIIGGNDDGKVSLQSTKAKGMKDHIVVPATHTFFPSNKNVQEQVVEFLKYGEFKHE